MKKRIIAIILMCTCFVGVGMSTPVYVSAESNETVSYTTQDLCTCIDKIDKMESIMNKIDKEYEKASNDGDKFKCKNCIVEYSLVTDALVNYAEKYYSRDLVKQIQEWQNKLTAKLKEVEDKVTKVYWENGGGSGAALDIPRMQCEVYKSRCYELINIYKQNKDKADESEITTCDKKLYDDKTKTGFKYVGNNECVYYDNGRMLIHEWKEFDDGYRYFNKNGLMAHDDRFSGIKVNSQGIAVGNNNSLNVTSFVPGFDTNEDLKFITHTCRVFDIPYEISYEDTYNKSNDCKISRCEFYNTDMEMYGYNGGYDEEIDGIMDIRIYKYSDRLKLME